MKKYSVLMVCTGNICRSPTADGVLRHWLDKVGLSEQVTVDSAGTQHYHTGQAPDPRAQMHAEQRGYDLSELRARQIEPHDFQYFDLVLAMDRSHLAVLNRLCPDEHKNKVRLFLEYARHSSHKEVPDPYYGGAAGFERVLDLIEDACAGLLDEIRMLIQPPVAVDAAG